MIKTVLAATLGLAAMVAPAVAAPAPPGYGLFAIPGYWGQEAPPPDADKYAVLRTETLYPGWQRSPPGGGEYCPSDRLEDQRPGSLCQRVMRRERDKAEQERRDIAKNEEQPLPPSVRDCREVPPAVILRMANRSPVMFRADAEAIEIIDARYINKGFQCTVLIKTTDGNGMLTYVSMPGMNGGRPYITSSGNERFMFTPWLTEKLSDGFGIPFQLGSPVASRTDHCAGLAPADLAIVRTFGLSCTDKR